MVVVYLVWKGGFSVRMENGVKIKKFGGVMVCVVKREEIDGGVIGLYGERMEGGGLKVGSDWVLLVKEKGSVLGEVKKEVRGKRKVEG